LEANLRILVTGGAGFIGSNFVIRTLETRIDHEITVLDSLTYAGSKSNLEPHLESIQFIEGDIRDSSLVEKLVSQSDLVVHFAAESHNDNSLKNPSLFYETNVMGTLNIAGACVKHDVRLHHISTDEVFGDLPLDSFDSFSLSTPYNPSSPYSASKAAADHLIKAWVRSFELRATISNCSNNYGPRQHWEKLIPNTIRTLLSGDKAKVYGAGLNVRDWIQVDDHVDGIWLAIDKGEIGKTYLFGAGDTLTNLRVVRSIIQELDLPESSMEFVADRPGHDLRYSIDASNSELELGWLPNHRSLIDSLPELVNWYREKLPERIGL
jgi:dTDP-glucose 4,6-dehydratase